MSRAIAAVLTLALGLAAAGPVPAHAQTPAPQAASPSPRALELAKRLMKASGAEGQVDLIVQAMVTQMASRTRGLTNEQLDLVAHTVRDVMREDFTPRLIDRMTPIYAQTFTEAELEAIVAFYESPVGKAAITRTPQLMQQSVRIAQELVPEAQAEVARRLCEKLGCDEEGRPKKS